jgi:hypothetical protein
MTATVNLDEVIAEALDATGLGWKRRDEVWVVPAGGRLPREVQIAPHGDVVHVRAVLVEWDEIGADEREAIGRFLQRAQGGLRFAHCELEATQAVVTASVEAGQLDKRLADAVGAVAAGCRMLAREVGALLAPGPSRAYLEFLTESEQGARRHVCGTGPQES